ncbi:MAG: ExbD/TolR family protein [Halorhodospira sp.]
MSLTPLIDVVFILLIFFMLASTFVEWQAFGVDAPAEGAAGEEQDEEPLRLHVTADGYRIGDEPVDADDLRSRFEEAYEADVDRRLLVIPAAGAPVRAVIRALDSAASAGLEDVAVLREEEEG